MSESLQILPAELVHFGELNDKETSNRSRKMLNITRDAGEFLNDYSYLPTG